MLTTVLTSFLQLATMITIEFEMGEASHELVFLRIFETELMQIIFWNSHWRRNKHSEPNLQLNEVISSMPNLQRNVGNGIGTLRWIYLENNVSICLILSYAHPSLHYNHPIRSQLYFLPELTVLGNFWQGIGTNVRQMHLLQIHHSKKLATSPKIC